MSKRIECPSCENLYDTCNRCGGQGYIDAPAPPLVRTSRFSQEEVVDTLNDLLLKERRRVTDILIDTEYLPDAEKADLEERLSLLNDCFGHVGGC